MRLALATGPYVPSERTALTRTWGSTSPTSRDNTASARALREAPAAAFARPRAISARVRWFPVAASAYGGDVSTERSGFCGLALSAGDASRSIKARTPPGARFLAIAYVAAHTTEGYASWRYGSMSASGIGRSFAAA